MSKMKDEAIRLANIEANRPPCPFCDGTGQVYDDLWVSSLGDNVTCPVCRGEGKERVCPDCEGYGCDLDKIPCRTCEGTGYHSRGVTYVVSDAGRYCPVPMGLKVVLLGIAFLWLWAIAEITMAVMR